MGGACDALRRAAFAAVSGCRLRRICRRREGTAGLRARAHGTARHSGVQLRGGTQLKRLATTAESVQVSG